MKKGAFHDCGTWDQSQGLTGGCDGSLVFSEINRPENNGLQDYAQAITTVWNKYNKAVSMADLLQVAGSVAIVTCPGGPRVTTYVGRADNTSAAGNPDGGLPSVSAPGDSLYKLFQAKGFSAEDLAALVGAHSTSTNVAQGNIPVNGPQDTTPGIWDTKFYGETTNPPAGVYPFASDVALAAHPVVGPQFAGFVNNQGKWTGKFADAMLRMSLLGVPGGVNPSKNMIDCTSVIPSSTSVKRDMKGFSLFAPRN